MYIFTDASTRSTKRISGLAFIITDSMHNIITEKGIAIEEKDNNTAELKAILAALEYVKHSKENVVIMSDSSYAINVIQDGKCRYSEKHIVGSIRRHMKDKKIRFMWIKGHRNTKNMIFCFNKRADKLANNARLEKEHQIVMQRKIKALTNRKSKERYREYE